MDHRTGSAVFISGTLNTQHRLREPFTIFTSKLLSVVCQLIVNLSPVRYEIASESMSAILVLQNTKNSTEKKNQNSFRDAEELYTNCIDANFSSHYNEYLRTKESMATRPLTKWQKSLLSDKSTFGNSPRGLKISGN